MPLKFTPKERRGPRFWLNLLVVGLLFGSILYFQLIAYSLIAPARSTVCCVTPADFGADYAEVDLEMPDGVRLAGWYLPSHNGAAVILLHGYGGNRLSLLYHAEALSRNDFGVLLFDQRASGESGGRWRTWGWQDVVDMADVLAFIQSQPNVDPKRIGVFGHSTGAEIALHAAARYPEIAAVVADGPGWSVASDFIPRNFTDRFMHAPTPLITWLMAFESGATPAGPLREAVTRISPRPVLYISTGETLEKRQAEQYYALSGAPKELWNIPEAVHGGGPVSRQMEYQRRLVDFFEAALLP